MSSANQILQTNEELRKVIQENLVSILSDKNLLKVAFQTVKQDRTLSICVSEYLTNLSNAGYSAKYQVSVRASLNHLQKYFNSEKKINSFDPRELEKFILYRKQFSPKGFQVDWRNTKAFFSKLVFWGYLPENPCVKIKIRREQKEAPAYLNRSELDLILSFVNSKILKSLYVFTFLTGLRASEVCNLTWLNVNLREKFIRIGDKNYITKSRKQRFIPLSSEAISILEAIFPKVIKQNLAYVFCKASGDRFTTDYISKTFKKAVRKAKLGDEIHLHSLRHSFATFLIQSKVPIINVKEILGHSSVAVTEIYSHCSLANLRSAVAVFDSFNPQIQSGIPTK